MATYEEDHDLPENSISPAPPSASQTRRHRLNLTEFFERAPPAPPSPTHHHPTTTEPHSPAATTDAFRLLASAFTQLDTNTPLMATLIELLRAEAEDPSVRGRVGGGVGVPVGWEDGLERVGRGELGVLGRGEDPYPLVVRLPCHPNHLFDLECIQPWLKLHTTCPLDRMQLVKEKPKPPTPQPEEDEEEWDDTYG
ncbi:hypothetical protein DFH27DRAFT_599149 [Peziza echinospora]|nr:hypothetical protein DFH27DRAFT_599149 [Peziza echinospora]